MKLSFVLAKTTSKANLLAINKVSQLIKTNQKVFFVVPDRATLNTELSILNELKIKGMFNCDVLTINKLAQRFSNQKNQTLSSLGAQLLIQKLLIENQNDLCCFVKMARNINFASELYKTIEQFKSSGITCGELKEEIKKLPTGLKLKLEDITLIWEKYEEVVSNSFCDGFSRIGGLINDLKISESIKECTFVFLDYGAATNQMLKVCFELIKNSKQVIFALAHEERNQANADIYENSTYHALIEFAQLNNIICEEIKDTTSTKMENQLFAFILGDKKDETNNIELFSCDDLDLEIKTCANRILESVYLGGRFDDFNVVLCNSEAYIEKIKEMFGAYKIPYFFDANSKIENHSLIKFVLAIVDCFCSNFQSNFVLELAKNLYSNNEFEDICDFENYVFKYGIEGAMFFSEFKDPNAEKVRESLIPLFLEYQNFIQSKTVTELVASLEKCLNEFDFKEKTKKIAEKLQIIGDLKSVKITSQIVEKLEEVFVEIQMILQNAKCSLFEFKSLFSFALNTKTISLVPVQTNSVFVGELNSSSFLAGKINYVLGASLNSFPANIGDVGIISDNEAAEINLTNRLSPSIKQLNQRALFKVFEICSSCKKLILSFAKNIDGEENSESLCAVDLKNIFKLKPKNVIYTNSLQDFENRKIISSCEIDELSCKEMFKLQTDGEVVDFKLLNKLNELTNIECKQFTNILPHIAKQLGNEFAITKIERYFACPMQRFLNDVLKLKERESNLIKALDIGNIIHEFAEAFLKNYRNIEKKDIEKCAIKIFDNILNSQDYDKIKEYVLNKPIIKSLRKEAIKIANVLHTYENESEFKVKYFEIPFGYNGKLKSAVLKAKNKIYYLKGKIDRVDVCGDYARVVDYKTGKDKFSVKELFYGKKIQLVSYLMVVCENGFSPAGAFYLPLNNVFNGKKFAAKLDGIILKDLNVVKKMDPDLKPLESAKFLNIKLTKDGEFNGSVGSSGLFNENEVKEIIDYVRHLTLQAIQEIENGNIEPSPLKSDGKLTCDYCPFKGMFCCFNAKVREAEAVSKENVCGGGKDDEQL